MMRTTLAILLLGALLTFTDLFSYVNAGAYIDDNLDDALEPDDYSDNTIDFRSLANNQKRTSRIYVYRRACIRRGGNCDNRPNDCCMNSACRCNLWGSSCKCQRMGLFQKWG